MRRHVLVWLPLGLPRVIIAQWPVVVPSSPAQALHCRASITTAKVIVSEVFMALVHIWRLLSGGDSCVLTCNVHQQ